MHKVWLLKTLALAELRRGFCAPNPAVGALVVENNEILSEGYHEQAGMPHAEVNALKQLQYPLTNATLYVSLEPCSHWGKMPPCIDEIVRSGIKKVVYAYPDPNPKVKAFDTIGFLQIQGIKCLQIDVNEITHFYESYHHWQGTKRPFVTLKIAQSLNGKIAQKDGSAVALSGVELNSFTHEQRKKADILLTTAQTIVKDNPRLNARLDDEVFTKPLAVIDRKQVLTSAKVLQCVDNIRHLYCADALSCGSIETKPIRVDSDNEMLNLDQIISHLGAQGYHDVWVEAGGKLASSLLKEKLINRMYVYVCGQWLPHDSIDAYVGIEHINETNFKSLTWQKVGKDMVAQIEF